MDKHPAGPRDCTVLTRQAEHRSSWLWDGPPTGQAWPGVLTCRHRFSCMPEVGLDPRVAAYITDAGLGGLLHVPNIEIDHALITALVERWRPETHSFHLPHGEMTITLQDMEVIMGVPVEGLPVVGKTNMEWGNLCHELLGHKPPDKEPHANENTAMLCGARLKLSWLKTMFHDPLPADATDLQVQQYARYYILEMLGGMLFMDKSGERISVMYLQFLNPISNGKKYSWGSAALSWLYRHLCKASETTAKQIGGALLLVQIWAYARFPHICPMMRHPHQTLPSGPLAVRWKVATCTTEHATHVLSAYRMSLASLRPNQIVWEPYKSVIGSLPSYCTAGQHIWRSTVPLLHFWVVEGHHPERVLRQFGMKQGVPVDVNTSTDLHNITLQGKHDKDWAVEHASHIAKWVAHAEVVNAPIFEGEMGFDDEYMKWFRRITRRFITKETSYWDTLVESHLRILAMCEPGSAIHTECMSALEAVEELSRLNLDNARVASNTSEPAAGRGQLVGGRRGHRGRHSGDGKMRPDKEPVRRRKRE